MSLDELHTAIGKTVVGIVCRDGDYSPELTPENTATFCARFLGQNQGTRHERKETQDRGNYPYSADG